MKQKLLIFCAAALLLTACTNSDKKETTKEGSSDTAANNIKAPDDTWMPIDSATMMAKMMEYGTPGPMHKMLASWSGTWNGETTVWDFEGATPNKSTGTAINTMIMDGKYQTSKHSGSMMGMPFEGMSITAYDNATKQFTSTWIDTWSTGIMTLTGSWDEPSKSLTLSGTCPDICRPGKETKMREVFKIIDDNTQHMEMYSPDPKTGKEFKMMEIKYTRKK